MKKKNKRLSRRATALVWLCGVGLVIGILIYMQQIALLYVLSTLALVLLLFIVGFSDLEKVGVEENKGIGAEN